jgi:transcriptional regulator
MSRQADLLPSTLDLMIPKAVSLGDVHGYGVLLRIEAISEGAILVQQGALYPALYRLEHQGLLASRWGTSEHNRRAKYYRLPPLGRRQFGEQKASSGCLAEVIALSQVVTPLEA